MTENQKESEMNGNKNSQHLNCSQSFGNENSSQNSAPSPSDLYILSHFI